MNRQPRLTALWTTTVTLAIGIGAVFAGSASGVVDLRSGPVQPGRTAETVVKGAESDADRWVVRFRQAPGIRERGNLEAQGIRVDAPLPGQAYLVSVPPGRVASLSALKGVDWATPYLPSDKISPEIAAVAADPSKTETIPVLLHLFADANPNAVAAELSAAGYEVVGAGHGSRFGRVVLLMDDDQVAEARKELSQRNDVYWVDRRFRRALINDDQVSIGQSGLNGGGATPIFDRGIYGEGQIAAVLDTGLDADMCFFRDGDLGTPPINDGTTTTVDPSQRKVIAVNFLDPGETSGDPTHWDTQGHGTHVAGTLAGDDLATPLLHDPSDGMAPGAKLVIQDGGYASDPCSDLPALGCPVTDLHPIFQQAYDQGARVHNNSWNDNENGDIQNNYSDGSQDVDEFIWANPDFLVVVGAGNRGLSGPGKVGSPGTAKNGISVGATHDGMNSYVIADLSSWGPTDDGRYKPDLVFPGQSITSAENDSNITTDNCTTRSMSGTSMATPGISGNALLVREYFMDGFYPTGVETPADAFTPSAALVKAALLNATEVVQFDNIGGTGTIPSIQQGWGRLALDHSLSFAGENRGLFVVDESAGFTSGSDPDVLYMVEVTDASEPLRVTLAWTDFPSTPAAATHLVNDLDLRVDGATGSFKGNWFQDSISVDHGFHDRLNNVEQVLIPVPTPGLYAIRISPHAVPMGPQPWALVVSGTFTASAGPRPSYENHVIDDSGPNGNGDGVLDPGETAIVPVTLFNAGDSAATSVLGTMFSANPELFKIYDQVAGYADMPVEAQASSGAPHYSVTLEPSVNCGQVVATTMSISGSGFQVGSGFSIDAGLRFQDLPSTDTPLSIPKSDTSGVYSFLTVPNDFPYNEVDVSVNIDHQDISELQVLLYAPGTPLLAINLHRNTDPGVSGIHTTYDDLTLPHGPGVMDDFLDRGPAGLWRLRVIDATGGGTPAGTLQDWTLHFKSAEPFNCNPVSCGQPVPTAVGDTLDVGLVSGTDALLSWTGVGAGDYNVWWDDRADFGNARHAGATGGATSYTDTDVVGPGEIRFYKVRSVNNCRVESP